MSSGRVPAWKRLGLELKLSNSNDASPESAPKRKRDLSDGGKPVDGNLQTKRAKSEVKLGDGDLKFTEPADQFQFGFQSSHGHADDTYSAKTSGRSDENDSGHPSSHKSRVKPRHSERTSNSGEKDGDRPAKRAPKQQKKAKPKKKAKSGSEPVSSDPPAYIAYLETYSQDRENWKFNKAHQTKLLNNLFHLKNLPPNLDPAIVDYVSGLQSFGAREHLRTRAYKATLEESEEPTENAGSEEMSAADIPDELRRAEVLSQRLSQTKRRLRELTEEEADEKLEKKREPLEQRLRAEQVLLALSETDKNVQPRAPVVVAKPPPPPPVAAGPRERRLPPTAEDAENAAVVQGFNKVTGALGSVAVASKKIIFDDAPDPVSVTTTEPAKRTRLRKKRTGLAALTGVPDDDDTSDSSSDSLSDDSDSDSSSSEDDSESSSSEESDSDQD